MLLGQVGIKRWGRRWLLLPHWSLCSGLQHELLLLLLPEPAAQQAGIAEAAAAVKLQRVISATGTLQQQYVSAALLTYV